MKSLVKATAAAALLLVAAATTLAQPANAFVPVQPDAIASADSALTHVSCGGIDCDAPRASGTYTYLDRYAAPRRTNRSRSRPQGNWRHRKHAHRHHNGKKRRVHRAVRNLVGAILDNRW